MKTFTYKIKINSIPDLMAGIKESMDAQGFMGPVDYEVGEDTTDAQAEQFAYENFVTEILGSVMADLDVTLERVYE